MQTLRLYVGAAVVHAHNPQISALHRFNHRRWASESVGAGNGFARAARGGLIVGSVANGNRLCAFALPLTRNLPTYTRARPVGAGKLSGAHANAI